MVINNFRPVFGTNIVVTATSSSSETALATDSSKSTISSGASDLLIQNTGSNKGYVKVGPAGGTASTADLCIPSGQGIIIRKVPTDAVIDVISASGTTFECMFGSGN